MNNGKGVPVSQLDSEGYEQGGRVNLRDGRWNLQLTEILVKTGSKVVSVQGGDRKGSMWLH